jgi:hypothetical protein
VACPPWRFRGAYSSRSTLYVLESRADYSRAGRSVKSRGGLSGFYRTDASLLHVFRVAMRAYEDVQRFIDAASPFDDMILLIIRRPESPILKRCDGCPHVGVNLKMLIEAGLLESLNDPRARASQLEAGRLARALLQVV